MELRLAKNTDFDRIWEMMLQAKAQMYREGKQQWDETYPAPKDILLDIEKGRGYVLYEDTTVVAYGAVVFDGEKAYENIQGEWLSELPYVVVHRLAVSDEVKRRGIATIFLQKVEQLSISKGIYSFRIDTNFDNFYMQRVIEKCKLIRCGEVTYERGSRIAYEKLLRPVNKTPEALTFRIAERKDAALILFFVNELAKYEKMEDEVTATVALYEEWLFDKKIAEVIFAVVGEREVGFALYFHNFSTFVGKAGIYLEDLYVLPEYRGRNYGKGLLKQLAKIAIQRGCGRLEWCCLDWNQPSIDFYLSLGAKPMEDWTIYRVAGKALQELAE